MFNGATVGASAAETTHISRHCQLHLENLSNLARQSLNLEKRTLIVTV